LPFWKTQSKSTILEPKDSEKTRFRLHFRWKYEVSLVQSRSSRKLAYVEAYKDYVKVSFDSKNLTHSFADKSEKHGGTPSIRSFMECMILWSSALDILESVSKNVINIGNQIHCCKETITKDPFLEFMKWAGLSWGLGKEIGDWRFSILVQNWIPIIRKY